LSFQLYASLKIEQNRIVKDDTATAPFVEKTKKSYSMGLAIPPPPIPATLHKAITIAKRTKPNHSFSSTGKTCLCSHLPFLVSALISSQR
jgi:hypothetical protein